MIAGSFRCGQRRRHGLEHERPIERMEGFEPAANTGVSHSSA